MKTLNVDPNKVNLSEKDIEDWLYANPDALKDICNLDHWIGRQFEIPSGRIDLLGVTHDKTLIVVELKNVEIDAGALAQVSRYALDISRIAYQAQSSITKIVIGKSLKTNTVLYEAEALDIDIVLFEVEYKVSFAGTLGWKEEYLRERSGNYDRIRDTGLFDEFFAADVDESAADELPEAFKDFLQGEQPDQPKEE